MGGSGTALPPSLWLADWPGLATDIILKYCYYYYTVVTIILLLLFVVTVTVTVIIVVVTVIVTSPPTWLSTSTTDIRTSNPVGRLRCPAEYQFIVSGKVILRIRTRPRHRPADLPTGCAVSLSVYVRLCSAPLRLLAAAAGIIHSSSFHPLLHLLIVPFPPFSLIYRCFFPVPSQAAPPPNSPVRPTPPGHTPTALAHLDRPRRA